MWDDLLMTVGDILLTLLPLPDSGEADDFFVADVLETQEKTRFSGRTCHSVHLRPLTRQPAAWYICRKKHLALLTPGRRIFVAVRKNKLVRVSELRQADNITVNKSEKEIKP